MNWARILAFVTGMVDQELLARSEYLVAENRILKAQLKGRLKLSDVERAALAEIGHRLGRKVLAKVANVARPDTILAWYRKLVTRKFDGSKVRRSPGRPRIKREVERLIVRMAKENRDWGYDRIAGALDNLGYEVCDQTVGNVLQRHGLPAAPERKRTTTWSAFIRTHLALLAGTDFFTAEVLTLRGLVSVLASFFTSTCGCESASDALASAITVGTMIVKYPRKRRRSAKACDVRVQTKPIIFPDLQKYSYASVGGTCPFFSWY
jgi:putative transposase